MYCHCPTILLFEKPSEIHSKSDEDITNTDILTEMRKLLKALKRADTKLAKYENEIKALKNEK